ncbi:MAG: N-formylglutamate amidohydrolase, partial [Solirubrobacterales bacterium]
MTQPETPPAPFEQAFFPSGPLTIAFESAEVSYSELPVDLYNSGVNQILSVAAVRGHRLLHFSMADLREQEGTYVADVSVLELNTGWDENDPLHAHRHLRVSGRETVELEEVQLFLVRADDVRNEETENIEILQWAASRRKMLESAEATLATTDKYGPIERVPQLPHPVTFTASSVPEALAAIDELPRNDLQFVLKDRYGFGCGEQVHRLDFDDPELEKRLAEYLEDYDHLLIQEFCAEVLAGDLVVTFFDDELIGVLKRIPSKGEWKTNASKGAEEIGYNLTPEQESIARALKRSYPECRLASIDLMESGRIIEINAFPGAEGLLRNYGIALGEIVMDRLEEELLGTGVEESAPAALSWEGGVDRFPTGTQWPEIEQLYEGFRGEQEVYDVFSGDSYRLDVREQVEFDARSPEYILSVPHAGLFVPEIFRDRFHLNEDALVEIDLYSDLCYEMAEGMHVRSELAPFFCDMNRTRDGADDGSLPRHLTNPAHEYYTVADRLMLQEPYSREDEERVLAYWDLYHGMLNALIDRMKRERGYALMFDCHSMTATGLGRVADEGRNRASFVAGTLEGASADSSIIDSFLSTLRKEGSGYGLGLTIARDVPYSGGFITRVHHNPQEHVHVIQLEVAMDTYMYEAVANAPKRYAIKRPRLKIVRQAV